MWTFQLVLVFFGLRWWKKLTDKCSFRKSEKYVLQHMKMLIVILNWGIRNNFTVSVNMYLSPPTDFDTSLPLLHDPGHTQLPLANTQHFWNKIFNIVILKRPAWVLNESISPYVVPRENYEIVHKTPLFLSSIICSITSPIILLGSKFWRDSNKWFIIIRLRKLWRIS